MSEVQNDRQGATTSDVHSIDDPPGGSGSDAAEIGQERYVERTLIGSGGQAKVFLAEEVGLYGYRRQVVIKEPLHPEERHCRLSIIDEARILGKLNHPNILKAIKLGLAPATSAGQRAWPYLVLDYVEGCSLKALLDNGARLELGIACYIMSELLAALHHLHERGMLHRDITPGNILLSVHGEVKLCDLGIAKAEDRVCEKTSVGWWKGTRPYASPEQWAKMELDCRTDLWSAGVVFYQMLAGKRPFWGATEAELERSICEANPDPVEKFVVRPEDFDPGIGTVLTGLLTKVRADRPSSALDVNDAITNGVPGSARSDLAKLVQAQRAAADRNCLPDRTVDDVPVSATLRSTSADVPLAVVRLPQGPLEGSCDQEDSFREETADKSDASSDGAGAVKSERTGRFAIRLGLVSLVAALGTLFLLASTGWLGGSENRSDRSAAAAPLRSSEGEKRAPSDDSSKQGGARGLVSWTPPQTNNPDDSVGVESSSLQPALPVDKRLPETASVPKNPRPSEGKAPAVARRTGRLRVVLVPHGWARVGKRSAVRVLPGGKLFLGLPAGPINLWVGPTREGLERHAIRIRPNETVEKEFAVRRLF